MPRPRLPNLFIIGGPKCGTTALSYYLAQHSHIYMSEMAGVKEPGYFSSDLIMPPSWNRISTWPEYVALFKNAPADVDYIGEASTNYLFSKRAVPEILRTCPDSRFIVMLRNPIELVQSLHNQRMKKGLDIPNFERAWRLQSKRQRGLALPYGLTNGEILQYGRIGKLGIQMARLRQLVPKDRVHVIVYDDFASRSENCYLELLNWLHLPADGRMAFPKLNSSVRYRWPIVEEVLRNLAFMRRRMRLGGRLGINAWIENLNRAAGRQKISAILQQELQDYFRADISLLSRTVGRDFSGWLQ